MRSTLGWLALLQTVLPGSSAGQHPSHAASHWAVGVAIGTSTYNGATAGKGDSGEDLVFVPYRPTMLGVWLARGGERLRLEIAARYGEPGLAIRGVPGEIAGGNQALLLVAEHAYKLAGLQAGISNRLTLLRGGPALRYSLGVSVERWTAPGTAGRTLPGAVGGLSLEIGITGKLVATIGGELGNTPGSPFQTTDLPEGFRQRRTWRRSLLAGMGLRW